VGLWLRLRAIPGPWGSDALGYVERVLADMGGASDTRSQRVLFLEVVRAGLGWSDGRPAGASWPGVAASAVVVVLLAIAGRRLLGRWAGLLPAALWAVLGLDVEEVVEVSADALAALPGAAIALALVAATLAVRSGRSPRAAFVAGGAAAGVGYLVKETTLFPAAGLAVGALLLGRGRGRLANVAWVAGTALLVVGAAALVGVAPRPAVASVELAASPEPVHWDEPGFARRMTFGVPVTLLTATGAFGLLHVVALPLVARTVVRALRGEPLAAASLTAIAVFVVMPVSFHRWGVLTAQFPRYLLPALPLWLLALAQTLVDPPGSRAERVAAWAGAALGFAFLRADVARWLVLPAGVTLTLWSSLPEAWRARLPAVHVRGLAAVALVAAAATAFATPWARTRPDPTWDAWAVLPRGGTVHADRLVGRRLALATRHAPGADATRIRLLDGPPPPETIAPGDLVLVRRGSALAAAMSARTELTPVPLDLGETLVLRRGPR
jgi:hypothetical protein